MSEAIYSGIFFEKDELVRLRAAFPASLANEIELPHVTLRYVARNHWPVYPELFGEKVELQVVAYACNKRNEGVRVVLSAQNPQLEKLCDEVRLPHITLSVADGAKPVNTRNLDFRELSEDKRIRLSGYYGAYMADGTVLSKKAR